MADTDIAIVGGGASMVLMLAHFAQHPPAQGLRVDVYERAPERLGRGIAYSTAHAAHLLNVRAINMSAYHDKKDHFSQWAADAGYKEESFVPRKIYGAYLLSVLEEAKKFLSITFVQADVESVKKLAKDSYILTYGQKNRPYRTVIQATGNVRPILPKIEGSVIGYAPDPWSAAYEKMVSAQTIGIIGTGLTAVDAALTLCAKGYQGKFQFFSRHTAFPGLHSIPAVYPPFLTDEDITTPPDRIFRRIRSEVRKAAKEGVPWQAVIDSLRPHTNPIWEKMDKKSREKFMKEWFTLWNVHRHRMAPEIGEFLALLRKAGRVETIKTSVEKITPGPTVQGSAGHFKVDALINCMGYRYREEGRSFEPAEKIGPACFGDLFETTAIPEIRAQAAEIAARIVKNF
jgi:uncharacterized NAD(P)/FAD-binding protein YdhS